ncbi:MAG: hypothetical protein AW12_00632 [Candidatus Accumulibacter sp. BA-94]|uniref:hypothetical protein n=1 Tax=Accumulibacter sp. TaxID=2053492 RepID=UPI0004478788|nr:hypothetical protein [Accumulibacter sp.]EXI92336.1 MAG: hypothetical protein AW12_00632 [Candidatus Accumulibacter sp. BA-94]MBL8392786.1 hypothetical protein [Accumulibacter sp.]HRD88168.1 hypothetical protein [Accumulibacter sp.]
MFLFLGSVEPRPGYRVANGSDNGIEGRVYLNDELWGEVYAAHCHGSRPVSLDVPHRADALIVAVDRNELRGDNPAPLRAFCGGSKLILGACKALLDRHAVAAAGSTVFRL